MKNNNVDIENAIKKLVEVATPLRYIINGIGLGGASAGARGGFSGFDFGFYVIR